MMFVGRSDMPEPQNDADVASQAASQVITDLRVLFVIDSRFPGLGGAEHQAVKLAQALKARGVAVEYIAPRVLEEGGHDGPELDGIPLTYIDYPHIKLVGSVVLMVKFANYLLKHRGQFDCMHVHVTRLLAATAGVVRPYSKIPIITKISGFFEFEGGVLDQRKRYYPLNAILRLALRNIDYVQTISEETRKKLLSSGFRQEQIALIPNGIDTSEPPSPMPESDVFTLGYCGRLREVKGVHVLLDAFAKSKKERSDAPLKLRLAGSGIAEDDLKAQAKALGIDNDVDFIGTIEDTAGFYNSLDLYVQPSFAEGLPNSVIEAMHAGRAVLATDIGGNHDLIQDNVSGRLFPAGDHEKLSQLILACYDDQADNLRMGKNGRGVIEGDYGMDTVIDKLVEVYREK